jgi:dolichol-phosphate mannosyltransferase
MHLTILAPVYNEAEVIETFYTRTKAVLESLGPDYRGQMLFVVDRSTDGTMGVLRSIAARDASVQVLGLSSRFGHQMSLLAGIDHARGADAIIMMDSDLQHPPELIPELLRQFELGNDVVYTIRRDTVHTGFLRKLGGRCFYAVIGLLSDSTIHQNAADFRLVSRRVVGILRTGVRERGLFLRGILSWVGFNQTGVEFSAGARGGGESKYSWSRMVTFAAAGILSFTTKPLRLGIFVGLFFSFLSVILGCATVVSYFLDRSIPPGWATLVILQLLFGGIQLIILGIIGAYIGMIYGEVKGRPHYIVEEAVNLAEERT